MPQIDLIVNVSSGKPRNDDIAGRITEIFASKGVIVTVHKARSGAELLKFARQTSDSASEIVVAAGGDGTISAVAAQLSERGKTLGVLPTGTLNHFAKDLGIPIE